ncbi:MAG: serine/threonine protein kinase [Methylomonas sp.]|jgi:serine/threonine-protein kinase|uniref:serine/threonine-protein kinase n=1 Tax=Methylomonas sp. TaxID=418 RepID=UPI0025D32558|nr:serine/threonine-protein kinase [Methylomonas sp.]MCK9607156.1 serine/threonine protein kinase [Methylomonas sp.]
MSSNTPIPETGLSDDDFTRLRPDNPAAAKQRAQLSDSKYPDHLTLLDLIDQGGMGRVNLAYDEIIGRRVAVKELLEEYSLDTPANIEIANTFIHEAKITGKLEHPGIVPIYELGRRKDGQPYYVMRYVKGETLEKSLRKCMQTASETAFAQRIRLLDIMIAACDTVAYAHSKGVIHRDLKPGNIISGNFGETILFDWGLAQVLEDNDNTYFYREAQTHQRHTLSDTHTSEVLGTPAYMAPEQFNGLASKASDVYSLGVILYRILTGELPYRGSLTDIQKQIESRKKSPSAKQINPAAPPELIAICAKAMQMQPENRFANAGELAAELKAFREGRMVNVYAYSKQELLHRFLVQNRTMLVMASLLLTAVIGGAGFSVYYARQMEQAKLQAEESLVVVTAFGEQAQKEARAIANSIENGTRRLFSDLNQAAAQIKVSDSDASQQLLAQLQSQYPKFESFSLRNTSEISTVFSKDGDDNAEHLLRPLAKIENKRVILIYRVPVVREGQVVNYLEARMHPEKVLPDFIPLNTQSDTHPRHTWIMREDGLIVFDELPEFIGSNLFIDPATNASPSLQSFGRQILVDDDSIGYYFFTHAGIETHKIAAWDSVNFGPNHSWKVIVDYAYMRKAAAPE